MKLSFYGAAQEVTGSCFLLETASAKVLIDCGMFQGKKFSDEKNHADFLFDPKTIDAVLLTHAHLDHTGRIPKLVREGFEGRLFATLPTAQLTRLIWDDSVQIMSYEQEKRGHPMLFNEDDVIKADTLFKIIKYGEKVLIGDITAIWHDAGHILGSGFIEIIAEGKRLIFSGDLGNNDMPILRPLEQLPQADVILMESTYGGYLHDDPKNRAQALRACIMKTLQEKGVLMIPAFSIERVQEILYELNELAENGKIPKVPIFLDSPLAIRATRVFKESREFYDQDAMQKVLAGDDLFDFPGLRMTMSSDESREINLVKAPKVIIAGAGMMTGGRILHHARRYLSDPKSTILFVGYQVAGTLGRAILDGAKKVEIYGEEIKIRARVEKIGAYSAHADQNHLVGWLQSAPALPKQLLLIHGEPSAQTLLAEQIKIKTRLVAQMPKFGEKLDL